MNAKEFVNDRDTAFIDFVETGSMKKLKAYFRKYKMPMPKSSKILKAAIYKAVQECTDIPQTVKDKAFIKCLELGFYPYMTERSIADED